MYAKVFEQIFDSSIADDYQLRHFFMDFLVLSDQNGVVDMTPTAISGRTRIPVNLVLNFLRKLEKPDAESRTPDHQGRRIALLDEHRTWGWQIINYHRFRDIASEQQRRAKTLARVHKFRGREEKERCNAPVTPCNARNAMHMHKHKHKQGNGARAPKPRFTAPDVSECVAYAKEIELAPGEAEAFHDHHTARGWELRTGKMKDWHAAMRTWKRNASKFNNYGDKKSGRGGNTVDRNAGTANEGRAAGYAKVGCRV